MIKRILVFICLCLGIYLQAQEQSTADTAQFETYIQEIPGTKVTFSMAPIAGGTFVMGSPETEENREEDEGPQFKVNIEPFWMGVHEVTFQEYHIYRKKELDLAPAGQEDSWDAEAITRPSPPYEDPTFGMGKEDFPAVSMTQLAALQYCKWLSDKTGIFYRLPTEAEWEYACRAGTKTAYFFGDDPEEGEDYVWHYDNSSEKYHKVGSKKPNPWGLYDMHGNVSEWTLDQYQKEFYLQFKDTSEVTNPWAEPTKLHPRTVKGGSWDDSIEDHRSASRIRSSMRWKERDPQVPKSLWWNTDSPFVGFRIIRPKNQPSAEEVEAFWEQVLGG